MNYQLFFENARKVARHMNGCLSAGMEAILTDLAATLVKETDFILQENKKDLDRMDPADPNFDRLQLTSSRIKDIAGDMIHVAELKNPLGEILSEKEMPNGLLISKVRVPLGVIGVIYEARPNVTVDVFSLCFKTGNISILKGSHDAEFSNTALLNIIHKVLIKHNIDPLVVQLLPTEREATAALLNAVSYVDVLIPRGSQQLIEYVRLYSKVPVIETGAGIVHTYFDESGNTLKGQAIICNAKTRRVSVCNALDCLLINKNRVKDLPILTLTLAEKAVELYADENSYAALEGHYPAALLHHALPKHFGTEFLSLKMAVKTVKDIKEAMDHIAENGSRHSEAIISEDPVNQQLFLSHIDAAAVYVNASTAFTDGAQFGLGAEIGISTQKLHARGPMGLEELTSYKWIIKGDGQIRQ